MNENFNGIWIPKEILMSKNLGQTEKLLISSIFTLDKGKGCYATNGYFSELLGISKDRASKVINKLIKLRYLNSQIIYKTPTREIEKRILSVNSQKFMEGLYENTFYPPAENSQEDKKEIYIKDNSRSFSKTEKEKIKDKVFHEKSEPYMLARFLEEQIQNHTPEFKGSEERRQRWAKDIDLMIRRNGLDPDKIADVIVWAHKNTFWKAFILSGKKLREKYLQLSIRMDSNR